MRLYQIGDRIFNLDAVTHATYDPAAGCPGTEETWEECVVSFERECQIFYGREAVGVWSLLCQHGLDVIPTGPNPATIRQVWEH